MRSARVALLALLLTASARSGAADRLELAIERIEGADWRVSGVAATLDLAAGPFTGELRVALLELPDAGLSFADTRVRCARIELSAAELACRDATVSLALPEAERQAFAGELVYARADGTLRFRLDGLALAGGTVNARGAASAGRSRIEISGSRLDLERLVPLANRAVPELAAFAPSGLLDVETSIVTQGGGVSELVLDLAFRGASFSNEAGTVVAAGTDAEVGVRAMRRGSDWELVAVLSADAGEAYVEPVYANLSETSVHASARGTVPRDLSVLALDAVALRRGELVAVNGTLDVRLPAAGRPVLVSGELRLEDASVEALYSNLLQVLAAGTLFGDLETAGTVSGNVRLDDNAIAGVDLMLRDIFLDDREGRLSIAGLAGEIHWPGPAGDAGGTPVTAVRWEAASAYRVPFGGASVRLRLGDDDVELLEPLHVPTLGGALDIERLEVSDFGAADASGVLDAALEPVQLGQLTAAFGWPAFSGTLSGRLPLLRYDGGVMTLGGSLTARAFDGDIELANLRLEEPFGLVPRLSGDIRLRHLDLELVTNAFSFGLIQGRLSGDVTGLELVGWRPVAMDLHLYTPPGDDSLQRISQRAVENLASVGGGGAAAALSSGFMKFFQVFAYDEIGLRCRLLDGTCAMSGAGPAGRDGPGGGYYIVRGKGLPRIDVVGYQSQVSFSRLVAQLESILETGAP